MYRSKHAVVVGAIVGAVLAWGIGELIGGWSGRLVGFGVLLAVITVLYRTGRNNP